MVVVVNRLSIGSTLKCISCSLSGVMLCFIFMMMALPVFLPSQAYAECGQLTDNYDSYSLIYDEKQFKDCWYFGIGAGVSQLDSFSDVDVSVFDASEDSSSGASIRFGKLVSPNLIIEGQYTKLGNSVIRNIGAPSLGFSEGSLDYSAFSLMAGVYSISSVRQHQFRGFLKGGLVNVSISDSGFDGSVSIEQNSSTHFGFSLGMDWYRSQSPWQIRGEYGYFAEDAQFIGISILRYLE